MVMAPIFGAGGSHELEMGEKQLTGIGDKTYDFISCPERRRKSILDKWEEEEELGGGGGREGRGDGNGEEQKVLKNVWRKERGGKRRKRIQKK